MVTIKTVRLLVTKLVRLLIYLFCVSLFVLLLMLTITDYTSH